MASAAKWAWIAVRAFWAAHLLDTIIGHDMDAPDLTIRRLQVVHRPGPLSSGAEEDVRITTHDFINTTDDEFDDTWTDADYLVVENAMDTYWAAVNDDRARVTVVEYRWYRIVPGEARNGPPVRVVPKSIAASSAASMAPPQLAFGITERTALAKHWGRYYIPCLNNTINNVDGRPSAAQVQEFANEAEAMYDTIAGNAAGIVPVVYSPRLRSALRVLEVQADDVWDIQRRRRWESTLVRERRTITGAS